MDFIVVGDILQTIKYSHQMHWRLTTNAKRCVKLTFQVSSPESTSNDMHYLSCKRQIQ